MRLRRAEPGDAEAAAALLRASIRELCADDHGGDAEKIAAWCANKTPETVLRWIGDPGQRVIVAERDGRLAGIASARTDGYVLLNYVDPGARFEGVSTRLLERIEEELAALGVSEARLESTMTALDFYRSRGWRDSGGPSVEFGMRGQPMLKRLAHAPAHSAQDGQRSELKRK